MEEVIFDRHTFELLVKKSKKKSKVSTLPESVQKKIKKALSTSKRHFKTDGWDLDANYIIDDVLEELFGMHFIDEVLQELINTTPNTMIIYGRRGPMVVLTKGHVFYNPEYNKMGIHKTKTGLTNNVYLGEL